MRTTLCSAPAKCVAPDLCKQAKGIRVYEHDGLNRSRHCLGRPASSLRRLRLNTQTRFRRQINWIKNQSETPMTDQKTPIRAPEIKKKTKKLPPLPPFTKETATQKVRLAEDAWNSRDAQKVALAYTIDSQWRNRAEFPNGRQEIIQFLTDKWAKELDYRLIKELWAYTENRIAVRFAYEW